MNYPWDTNPFKTESSPIEFYKDEINQTNRYKMCATAYRKIKLWETIIASFFIIILKRYIQLNQNR